MSDTYYRKIIIFIITLLLFSPLFANTQIENNDNNSSDILIDNIISKRTSDLDNILKSRVIRVLVIPSRTMYYVDKGKKSGIYYEMMTEFEKSIRKRYPSQNKHIKIQVVFVPVSRDKLITGLIEEKAIEDLSGKKVFIRRSSSYWEYLEELNVEFSKKGLAHRQY